MVSNPSFMSPLHPGVRDGGAFQEGLELILSSLQYDNGIYVSDSLITFSRNLGFIHDRPLLEAWNRHAASEADKSILWRTANIAWAVRQAKRLDGDFVECGVYQGYTARVIVDLVDISDRRFWLYDAFLPVDGQSALPGIHEGLEAEVRGRFAGIPHVNVVAGIVPDSFAKGVPDKVAFAHIDMNNVAPEIAALEMLESRLVPGAIIILDDYGWLNYRAQFLAEMKWFGQRGRSVMELPTGQGLVIW